MKYNFNGKQINIPDKEIKKSMELLELTEEEAIEMWLEDNGYLENEEQEQLDAQAKGQVKVLAKAGEKVTGFDYVKALSMETGVKVQTGLKDLEQKPVIHNNVCEINEMPKVVIEAL